MKHPIPTPEGLSKGIVIFTHKERPMIQARVPGMARRMARLKQHYVLGMHWGSPHDKVAEVPYMDFHLGGQGTLSLTPDNPAPHIPLCSRNFLPPCFHPEPAVTKVWDILAVAGPRRLKNLDELMVVLRQLLNQRPNLKALIVSACDNLANRDPILDYIEIQNDYEQLFTPIERENNVVLQLLEADGGVAYSQPQLAELYRASKIFTLFTNKEGESRVISEALCCGVPVVVKRHLAGGGRDYLNETNSRQFDTLDEAVDCFAELLDNDAFRQFDVDAMLQVQSEHYTANTITQAMAQQFERLRVPFMGKLDTEHLSFKLPSHHYKSLPAAWRNIHSNDISSPWGASMFVASLLKEQGETGYDVSWFESACLKCFGQVQHVQNELNTFLKRPGQWLRLRGWLNPKPIHRATSVVTRS